MTKRNATAFHAETFDDLHKPGAYEFWEGGGNEAHRRGLHFGCPCGCGAIGGVEFGPGGWTVTGEWPKASMMPSIGFVGGPQDSKPDGRFHWHGFLKEGVFEEC